MLIRVVVLFSLSLFMFWCAFAEAGVREASTRGSSQMLVKLQGMVRKASQERDTLKTENATLQDKLDRLTKQNAMLETDGNKISKKLARQQGSNKTLQVRQQQTFSKLEEVIEKYKVLRQQNNQKKAELTMLQGEHQGTSQQLQLCSQHNGKLIAAANELLERYQNKGTFDGLLQSEGLLQFKSVEMEAIVQEYEDKIGAEEYLESASLNN
jgi:septal ring factor EnvC (AmiA/AmiB activator)